MLTKYFSRTIVSLITILCLLSLVSIGFASWTIAYFDIEEEFSGSLESDVIINSKEFVYLDKTKGDIDENNEYTGVKCFKYQDYGYLSEDGTYVDDTGYVYNYFILDVKECYKLLKDDFRSIDIIFRISYSDDVSTTLNLFSGDGDASGYHELTAFCENLDNDVRYNLSEIENDKNQQYSISLKLIDLFNLYENGKIDDKITITIKYAFFATTGDYFNKKIFTYMYKDMIEVIDFKVNVYLLGTESTSN